MKYSLIRNDQGKIVTNLAWDISESLIAERFGFQFSPIFVVPGTNYNNPFETSLFEDIRRQLWEEPLNQSRMFEQLPEAVERNS